MRGGGSSAALSQLENLVLRDGHNICDTRWRMGHRRGRAAITRSSASVELPTTTPSVPATTGRSSCFRFDPQLAPVPRTRRPERGSDRGDIRLARNRRSNLEQPGDRSGDGGRRNRHGEPPSRIHGRNGQRLGHWPPRTKPTRSPFALQPPTNPLAVVVQISGPVLARQVEATADLGMLVEQAVQADECDAGTRARAGRRREVLAHRELACRDTERVFGSTGGRCDLGERLVWSPRCLH